MAKFTILFAALALFQVAYGCGTCGCGSALLGGDYLGGSYAAGLGSGYLGHGYGLGAGYLGSGSYLGGYGCTPYTSCTTGTCARPVTVCQQAWQQYPCTQCSTGLACGHTHHGCAC